MRRRGRSYGSCRTWPAISRRSGRLRSWINKHRPGTIRRRRQRCRKRNGNCLLVSQESVRRAASRLPLVGPAGTVALRRSKTKTSYEGKPKEVGGRRPPPVGRPRTNNRASALKHHKIPWRKTIAIGGAQSRLPLVGPGDQNLIRKETLAAGRFAPGLQAHSSMRKCWGGAACFRFCLFGRQTGSNPHEREVAVADIWRPGPP